MSRISLFLEEARKDADFLVKSPRYVDEIIYYAIGDFYDDASMRYLVALIERLLEHTRDGDQK